MNFEQMSEGPTLSFRGSGIKQVEICLYSSDRKKGSLCDTKHAIKCNKKNERGNGATTDPFFHPNFKLTNSLEN